MKTWYLLHVKHPIRQRKHPANMLINPTECLRGVLFIITIERILKGNNLTNDLNKQWYGNAKLIQIYTRIEFKLDKINRGVLRTLSNSSTNLSQNSRI